MQALRNAGLLICLLMVLTAFLNQIAPSGKNRQPLKMMISMLILLSLIAGLREMDFGSIAALFETDYQHHAAVWDQATELVAEGLKNEMNAFLQAQSLRAEVESLVVEHQGDSFTVRLVLVRGVDASPAKNLLAGRYRIGIAYIEEIDE